MGESGEGVFGSGSLEDRLETMLDMISLPGKALLGESGKLRLETIPEVILKHRAIGISGEASSLEGRNSQAGNTLPSPCTTKISGSDPNCPKVPEEI